MLLLFALLAATAFRVHGADSRVYDVVQIGQSYRTPMEMIRAFAEARGKTFQFKAFLPPGVPIHAHWFRMERGTGKQLAGETDYRVLCLVPYYDFNENSPLAAANFFGLGLKRTPDIRAYLVNHWPSRAMSMEEKEAWCAENLDVRNSGKGATFTIDGGESKTMYYLVEME